MQCSQSGWRISHLAAAAALCSPAGTSTSFRQPPPVRAVSLPCWRASRMIAPERLLLRGISYGTRRRALAHVTRGGDSRRRHLAARGFGRERTVASLGMRRRCNMQVLQMMWGICGVLPCFLATLCKAGPPIACPATEPRSLERNMCLRSNPAEELAVRQVIYSGIHTIPTMKPLLLPTVPPSSAVVSEIHSTILIATDVSIRRPELQPRSQPSAGYIHRQFIHFEIMLQSQPIGLYGVHLAVERFMRFLFRFLHVRRSVDWVGMALILGYQSAFSKE